MQDFKVDGKITITLTPDSSGSPKFDVKNTLLIDGKHLEDFAMSLLNDLGDEVTTQDLAAAMPLTASALVAQHVLNFWCRNLPDNCKMDVSDSEGEAA